MISKLHCVLEMVRAMKERTRTTQGGRDEEYWGWHGGSGELSF